MERPSATETSDTELIAACRAGARDAWLRLVQRYEGLVFSVPLHHGLTRDESEDVVQTTFEILLQSLNELRADSNLSAWLCTVARRHTWRLIKRNAKEVHPEIAGDLDWAQFAEALSAGESQAFEHWELADLLNRGLAELGGRCREMLIALYFDVDKPSYVDLAERWGVPLGTIGPTRARCLERLRQILSDS